MEMTEYLVKNVDGLKRIIAKDKVQALSLYECAMNEETCMLTWNNKDNSECSVILSGVQFKSKINYGETHIIVEKSVEDKEKEFNEKVKEILPQVKKIADKFILKMTQDMKEHAKENSKPTTKKGSGRPKGAMNKATKVQPEIKVKRGRGRPKKVVKRGRGRPKKQ